MTYDTDTQNDAPTPQEQMNEVCADLMHTLSVQTDGPIDTDTLARQAKLLDDLLSAVMRRNLQGDLKRGHFSEYGLAMALRIQKQCVDTIKAASTIEYMKQIKAMQTPTPPQIGKRTSEAENDI